MSKKDEDRGMCPHHEGLERKIDQMSQRFMDKLEGMHEDIGMLKGSQATNKNWWTTIIAIGAALLAWFKP